MPKRSRQKRRQRRQHPSDQGSSADSISCPSSRHQQLYPEMTAGHSRKRRRQKPSPSTTPNSPDEASLLRVMGCRRSRNPLLAPWVSSRPFDQGQSSSAPSGLLISSSQVRLSALPILCQMHMPPHRRRPGSRVSLQFHRSRTSRHSRTRLSVQLRYLPPVWRRGPPRETRLSMMLLMMLPTMAPTRARPSRSKTVGTATKRKKMAEKTPS